MVWDVLRGEGAGHISLRFTAAFHHAIGDREGKRLFDNGALLCRWTEDFNFFRNRTEQHQADHPHYVTIPVKSCHCVA